METDTVDRLERAYSDCRTIIKRYNLFNRLDALREAVIPKDKTDSELIKILFETGVHFVADFGDEYSPKDAAMSYFTALGLIRNNRIEDYEDVISSISLDVNMIYQSLMP